MGRIAFATNVDARDGGRLAPPINLLRAKGDVESNGISLGRPSANRSAVWSCWTACVPATARGKVWRSRRARAADISRSLTVPGYTYSPLVPRSLGR